MVLQCRLVSGNRDQRRCTGNGRASNACLQWYAIIHIYFNPYTWPYATQEAGSWQRLKHTVRRLATRIQVTIAQRGTRASFIQPHTAIHSCPILLHGRCIAILSIVICTYFGGHWPLVLVCWISPVTSISKRGRVRSGRDVIYWFLTLQICCWRCEEKGEQLFFGYKIPDLESDFWKFQYCGPSLEYCVRVWCKLIRKWPRNTPISVTR